MPVASIFLMPSILPLTVMPEKKVGTTTAN